MLEAWGWALGLWPLGGFGLRAFACSGLTFGTITLSSDEGSKLHKAGLTPAFVMKAYASV